MEAVIDKKTWEKYFDGFTIYDCAILREQGFGFVLVEVTQNDDSPPRTRIINMATNRPMEERFASIVGDGLSFTTLAVSMNPREYVAVDTGAQVCSSSGTHLGDERAIDELISMDIGNGIAVIIYRVVRVAGHIYALGSSRQIYRRIGIEQWIELGMEGKGVPLPGDEYDQAPAFRVPGFRDMSAFSADDMYAVGGDGDVWHFDGTAWHSCPFPTDASLETVCCAGDGLVYITDIHGSVWAGRSDGWTRIATASMSPGFQPVDACWFNDRLYLGAQEGIWTIDAAKGRLVRLQEMEPDAPNVTNSGRLDISADGNFMLTAGPYGACIRDATGWRQLFSGFDFL